MFWSDWESSRPRIERASMSGENRRNLFDIQRVAGGGWPNGLALDFDVERLYWIDARSNSIHTVTYDGLDHHVVVHGTEHIQHPFSIALFDDKVYWTEWQVNAIVSVRLNIPCEISHALLKVHVHFIYSRASSM